MKSIVWSLIAFGGDGVPKQGSPPPAPVAAPATPDPKPDDAKPADPKAADPKPADPAPAVDPAAIKVIAENHFLAAVNNDVVTIRDVDVAERLENRRSLATKTRTPEEVAKQIVEDRLWVAHARTNPLYGEFVTPRVIEDQAKEIFGSLYDDPTVPADERALMRFKGESFIAMQIALQNDPEFKRSQFARPRDVQRYWDQHPTMHRIGTRVSLGRVILGRDTAQEFYGEPADVHMQKLRQRAVELGSLEAAAKELAAGAYQTPPEYDLERDTGLREEVLEFAKNAQPGEVSPIVSAKSSVMLFTMLARSEGKDVTYEEAAGFIRKELERRRMEFRAEQYFVTRVLSEAYFRPQNLFDDEIEKFFPGRKAALAARARAAAQQKQDR